MVLHVSQLERYMPICPRGPWICLNEDVLYIYHGYFCINKKHSWALHTRQASIPDQCNLYTVYILYNYYNNCNVTFWCILTTTLLSVCKFVKDWTFVLTCFSSGSIHHCWCCTPPTITKCPCYNPVLSTWYCRADCNSPPSTCIHILSYH